MSDTGTGGSDPNAAPCERCGQKGWHQCGNEWTLQLQPLQGAVTRQGWECPRCQVIHAPHVDRCDCSAYGSVSTGGNITITPVST